MAEIRRRIAASGSGLAATTELAPRKRQLSAAACKRIAGAQSKCWAAFRRQREEAKQAPVAKPVTKLKKAAIRKPAPRTAAKNAAARKAAGKKAKPVAVARPPDTPPA